MAKLSDRVEGQANRRTDPGPPVVVVAGATASGKSAAALAIAEAFGGAIVNADSMQVYRELRVLTARPSDADMARAPHALYGTMAAAEPCSAAIWLKAARQAVGPGACRRPTADPGRRHRVVPARLRGGARPDP